MKTKTKEDEKEVKYLGVYVRTSSENKDSSTSTPTTDRQRNLGIQFAQKNKFKYEVYEDSGKSGYRISENEFDPMNNRPGFSRLIDDIKNGKIDKVWVWEHSRLSRNTYASAFIFNIFEKYNITLYENEKVFDLDNPEFRLQRQILDAISEYERHLIVNRMNSGRERKVNEGYKVHPFLYGYRKAGKDETGHVIWKPVKSQLEVYKFSVRKCMEGSSLRRIASYLSDNNKIHFSSMAPVGWLSSLLRKYQYTGYQLTTEGYDIFKRFLNQEIDNIKVLSDKSYWIKSIHYPLELITVDEWIELCHKLQINKRLYAVNKNDRLLTARSALATGLVECCECGSRYYYQQYNKNVYSRTDERKMYHRYYHFHKYVKGTTAGKCNQKPHTFPLENVDEVLKIFYFFFYLVFDNTLELSKKTEQKMKMEKLVLKEKIETVRNDTKRQERQIPILKRAMETESNVRVIQRIGESLLELEEKMNTNTDILNNLEVEYQSIIDNFDKNRLEVTYYDVKERINNWFKKLDVEQQRNELRKVIVRCVVFNHYLLIDTGTIAFLFDIHRKHVFDNKLLKIMDKDEIYKLHFIELKNRKEVRRFEERLITNFNFSRSEDLRALVFRYMTDNYNVIYNLNNITNLISFVSFRGLYSQDLSENG